MTPMTGYEVDGHHWHDPVAGCAILVKTEIQMRLLSWIEANRGVLQADGERTCVAHLIVMSALARGNF